MAKFRCIGHFSFFFFIASLLLVVACGARGGAGEHALRYELRGRIVSFDRAQQQVVISHGDVPGLMEGMTMPFTLREESAYDVMKGGSSIQATLVVDEGRSWLENPVISDAQPETIAGTVDAAQPAEPTVGDALPAFTLLNQDTKHVRLASYHGKILAITFIYTRCPLPDYCALMSANFAQLNRALSQEPALAQKVQLLSVTLDPAYDTPKVLRSYGAAYTENYSSEKFARWEFATGEPDEVHRLASFFGLIYDRQGDQITHSLRTAVVTPDGKLYKLYRGNEWKPDEMLNEMRALAGAK